jgi:hypothetical protein
MICCVQIIDITVNISSNHKGYFEFRLCPKSSASELVTQECLNANLLKMADDTTRFYLPSQDSKPYFPRVKLPAGLICENCVLQWLYNTGTIQVNSYNITIEIIKFSCLQQTIVHQEIRGAYAQMGLVHLDVAIRRRLSTALI